VCVLVLLILLLIKRLLQAPTASSSSCTALTDSSSSSSLTNRNTGNLRETVLLLHALLEGPTVTVYYCYLCYCYDTYEAKLCVCVSVYCIMCIASQNYCAQCCATPRTGTRHHSTSAYSHPTSIVILFCTWCYPLSCVSYCTKRHQ
jgi:hypothetical protein